MWKSPCRLRSRSFAPAALLSCVFVSFVDKGFRTSFVEIAISPSCLVFRARRASFVCFRVFRGQGVQTQLCGNRHAAFVPGLSRPPRFFRVFSCLSWTGCSDPALWKSPYRFRSWSFAPAALFSCVFVSFVDRVFRPSFVEIAISLSFLVFRARRASFVSFRVFRGQGVQNQLCGNRHIAFVPGLSRPPRFFRVFSCLSWTGCSDPALWKSPYRFRSWSFAPAALFSCVFVSFVDRVFRPSFVEIAISLSFLVFRARRASFVSFRVFRGQGVQNQLCGNRHIAFIRGLSRPPCFFRVFSCLSWTGCSEPALWKSTYRFRSWSFVVRYASTFSACFNKLSREGFSPRAVPALVSAFSASGGL